MGGKRRPEDILWLYTGWINDSMTFNIVEYLLGRVGLIVMLILKKILAH